MGENGHKGLSTIKLFLLQKLQANLFIKRMNRFKSGLEHSFRYLNNNNFQKDLTSTTMRVIWKLGQDKTTRPVIIEARV